MKTLQHYSVQGGANTRCFGEARNTARKAADKTGKPVDVNATDMVFGRDGFTARVACTVQPTATITKSGS